MWVKNCHQLYCAGGSNDFVWVTEHQMSRPVTKLELTMRLKRDQINKSKEFTCSFCSLFRSLRRSELHYVLILFHPDGLTHCDGSFVLLDIRLSEISDVFLSWLITCDYFRLLVWLSNSDKTTYCFLLFSLLLLA